MQVSAAKAGCCVFQVLLRCQSQQNEILQRSFEELQKLLRLVGSIFFKLARFSAFEMWPSLPVIKNRFYTKTWQVAGPSLSHQNKSSYRKTV